MRRDTMIDIATARAALGALPWRSILAVVIAACSFAAGWAINGWRLGEQHHTGKDAGIYDMPFPLWIAQRYAIDGYQFTPNEVIHHADGH